MGRRQFTIRTLLLWMVVFALLCGALSAFGAPLPVFVPLFSWVAVVWFLTLFCSPRVACGVSAAIPVLFVAVLGPAIQAESDHGPSSAERVGWSVILILPCAACGVALYGVIAAINRLIERDGGRDEDDAGHDRGGSDG